MISFYNGLSSAMKGSIAVMVAIAVISFLVGRRVKKLDPQELPKGGMFIAVLFVDMVNNMIRPMFPKYFKQSAPIIITMFMFVLLANLSSLFGFTAPLSNINIALSVSIIVFLTIQIGAMIVHKPKKRAQSLLSPSPLFLPLNLIGEFSTPFSMGMRLFGNLLSGSILSILVYSFTSYFGIIAGAFILHPIFDVFFGAIQAYVFLNLFIIFLSLAVED
ncbi:F-type H+-transporting ATPase subunit a [Acholeplasma morum]|uniref:F0F1 ATP synthase subunit A n=1 Tax=Paracholeplasma morum TaxID=264637 RepID=UPI00195CA1AA|nr:FoF1 ATP synthase subunit a [Paracholeplasma morum]MBM7454023.1 F-type H+-transporting ATPase subunit a [Paracholeplasma morum]